MCVFVCVCVCVYNLSNLSIYLSVHVYRLVETADVFVGRYLLLTTVGYVGLKFLVMSVTHLNRALIEP